jgi:integrase
VLYRRETSVDDRRNSEGSRYWCGGRSRIFSGKDGVENFFNSEEERRMAENSRLYAPECILQECEVQNGGQSFDGSVVKKKCVWDQYRHQGGVSSCDGTPRVSRLPLFRVRSSLLSVPGDAIRGEDGTPCVHKNHASLYCSDQTSLERDGSSIYRRSVDWSRRQSLFGDSSAASGYISKPIGLADKSREVRANSEEGVCVSGMAMEYSGNDGESSQRKEIKSIESGERVDQEVNSGEDGESQGLGFIDRLFVSDKVAVSVSESVSVGFECGEDRSSTQEFLERFSGGYSQDTHGVTVVEGQAKSECTDEPGNVGTADSVVDGCFSVRMGSVCSVEEPVRDKRGEISVRSLDEQLVIEQERVSGSAPSGREFVERGAVSGDEVVASVVGQLDHGIQLKQEGVIEHSDSVNEKVVSSIGGKSVICGGSPCEGSAECKSGQSVKAQQSGGLCIAEGDIIAGVGGVPSADRLRSVRVVSESQASSVLHRVTQGHEMLRPGCVQHSVGSVESCICAPSDSVDIEMFKENPVREGDSGVSGASLVGSTVESDSYEDDSEDENTGRVILSVGLRQDNAQDARQASPRTVGGIPGGRRNDVGEDLVMKMLVNVGLSEYSKWFFDSVAVSTFRNYRRGFTLFAQLLQEARLNPVEIKDSQIAVSVLVRILNVAFQKKLKLSAVTVMKTAVVRLFDFMFGADIGEVSILKMAMRYYTTKCVPKKEDLKLEWSVEKLFEYFMTLPSWVEMEFNCLMRCALVLCMVFSTLRFTEILSLNMVDTNPDEKSGVWKFWTRVKGHNCVEPVYLQSSEENHLNPVAALVELRKRIFGMDKKAISFWYRVVDGKLVSLSYNELRKAAVELLFAAGIQEKKPYHIKHAVLTYLDRNGVSAQGIAAFARHKFGSMMQYKHYIAWDHGKSSADLLVNAVKKN